MCVKCMKKHCVCEFYPGVQMPGKIHMMVSSSAAALLQCSCSALLYLLYIIWEWEISFETPTPISFNVLPLLFHQPGSKAAN